MDGHHIEAVVEVLPEEPARNEIFEVSVAEGQPWIAYALVANSSGVLTWNVASDKPDYGPPMEDRNRYGNATLQVNLNDLPQTCGNAWVKVGLIEMGLNEWGGVDRYWVYEQEVRDWDGSDSLSFDDAPKGRYGVEVVAHCDENNNRAQYQGTYDWMHKWDWENESTVELKDEQTTIVSFDMYKTGVMGNTNVNLTATVPSNYVFSTTSHIGWSHEKDCSWFDDWDNGMNETGMFWCSWEDIPDKDDPDNASWWYWCTPDENNKGWHCTDEFGMRDGPTDLPAVADNRCQWAELILVNQWRDNRHDMQEDHATSFGWGMHYDEANENRPADANSIIPMVENRIRA